ncbi:MAG: hypothetical protein U9R69_04425, partial [Thermodesulfobacteriota bacterium]|nr:hypothetical protein [Thermodesulfobacteriota bacterium]
ADLQLRDFTINAFALPLDVSFPDSKLLDPLSGSHHLQQKQLHSCSRQSFLDDPLRMLKGIRHAVTLGFALSDETRKEITTSKDLLDNVAGERIRDELGKILDAENVINGIELLIDTGLLRVIFGSEGWQWDRYKAIDEIGSLNAKILEIERLSKSELAESGESELYSRRAIFLLSRLLKNYSPRDLSELLHDRLRLSRDLQRLLEELQTAPDLIFFTFLNAIDGQRRQALLVEQLEPFAYEKMLYWGIFCDRMELKRLLILQKSFSIEQKLGRIPDLLNGRQIASFLDGSSNTQIGKWQSRLKQAEINGEIETCEAAEDWLKKELLFDNPET